MRVAMVGLGRMGLPMAGHIAAAGHELVCFDVADSARARATEAGLAVVESADALAEAAADIELVCSSLPATEHVEEAILGAVAVAGGDGGGDGLAAALPAGAIWADLSTISIAGSRSLAKRCRAAGVTFLDTPVSGTSTHAAAATLVVMAGGNADAVERARPVLETFSSRVARVGGNGAGLELKLITNRLLTTHLAAIAEAIVSLEDTELSVDQAIELLQAGAVPRLLDYKAGPLATRDYTPLFTVDLMAKDLRLAAEGLPEPPLAAAAHELVDAASEAGLGDADVAAIMEIVEGRFRP